MYNGENGISLMEENENNKTQILEPNSLNQTAPSHTRPLQSSPSRSLNQSGVWSSQLSRNTEEFITWRRNRVMARYLNEKRQMEAALLKAREQFGNDLSFRAPQQGVNPPVMPQCSIPPGFSPQHPRVGQNMPSMLPMTPADRCVLFLNMYLHYHYKEEQHGALSSRASNPIPPMQPHQTSLFSSQVNIPNTQRPNPLTSLLMQPNQNLVTGQSCHQNLNQVFSENVSNNQEPSTSSPMQLSQLPISGQTNVNRDQKFSQVHTGTVPIKQEPIGTPNPKVAQVYLKYVTNTQGNGANVQ